jgi:hypothetical protein
VTFYNSAGQQITGGSTNSGPFAAYELGSFATGGTKALTYIAIPGASDPSGWTKLTLGDAASPFPNAGAPANLASAGTLPLVTNPGASGTLDAFVAANPDPGNPAAGYYQVRVITSGGGANGTIENAADIQINTTTHTWTLAYPTPAAITSTTTLNALPASPQVAGTSVTLTAQVADADSSSPVGGTVQFQQNGANLGSPVTVASNGQASLSTSALATGTDSLTAVFTPVAGTNYTGSTSSASSFVVTASKATTTGLTSSLPSPVSTGTSVTFTAAVANGDATAPTGTVTFEDGGTPITGESNVPLTGTGPYTAAYTTSTLGISTHALSAVYNPPAGYASSTGTESFTVNPAGDATTTSLSVNPSVAPALTNVTINAAVVDTTTPALTPTGSVNFYDNGTSISGTVTGSSVLIGTAPLGAGGIASLTFGGGATPATQFAIGAHNLVAVYAGSAPSWLGSTSSDVVFTALGAASPAADAQNLQVSIPAGGLYISTPYTPTNPFDLGTAVLNPATATFSASAPFGSASNPGAGVSITDTQSAGSGWTAFAQTTDFTSGVNKINGQNLTLTGVTPSYIPGNALTTGSVLTNSVTDTGLGGASSYGVAATGTDGLQGLSEGTTTPVVAHQFAKSASVAPGAADGSVYVYGVLNLVAPSSTPAGTYTATLTFTIS